MQFNRASTLRDGKGPFVLEDVVILRFWSTFFDKRVGLGEELGAGLTADLVYAARKAAFNRMKPRAAASWTSF